MPNRDRFRIEPASDPDVQEIHSLVFANPEPHIRQLQIDDVAQLVDDGVLWVARDVRKQQIVAVCYVKVPYTKVDIPPEPAEYGGAFVHNAYRRNGLGTLLANIAICHYFWDNDPESPDPLPLVAHVHIENPKPRTILANLGFVFDKQIVVPDGIAGFEHMPQDDSGQIRGDEFRFDPGSRIPLYETVAQMLENPMVEAEDGKRSEIECRVGPGFSAAALRQLAKHLKTFG